ncbi:RNA polymerase subunit sigma-24 [Rouxiella badensis]|uniref:RNA polymerase subunit sigma-24 n=1 Tax=Rouxiella badensis TaxID=1646377 RepID=UPI001D14E728|nr:RNA polymerase subunit sigma-24 [Rouxiella badensis]MCC3734704.1 RNA polymerase subunit sigma-24 [Rouxiella badensis]MCC3760491.1 RNA polymerase subunit sigma-24 [Rouxiella badensis]
MFDNIDLPTQFSTSEIPSDLNKIGRMMWGNFQGGWIPSANDLQAHSIKVLYERYKTLHGRDDMKAAVADKLRAESAIRRIAMQNPNRISLNQSQVTRAVKTSLDVYHTGEAKPSISIVRDLLPGKDVKPVMSRPQQRKRMKKALKANASHPAVQTAVAQGNPIRMDADTLSSGLMSLQNAAMVVRKLNDHEQRMLNMEARLKELEAFKDSTEKRHAIEDAGQDPRELARSMHTDGKSLGEIAKVTGRSRSTIQHWVK